jgi:hypothetical protein
VFPGTEVRIGPRSALCGSVAAAEGGYVRQLLYEILCYRTFIVRSSMG